MTREEAINLLDNLIGMVEDNQNNDYDEAFKMAIRSLKSWDEDLVEVKRGVWGECEIVQESGDEPIIDEWQSARCSVCGKYHTTPYMYYFDNFNYCPNCGADMRGEEDGI